MGVPKQRRSQLLLSIIICQKEGSAMSVMNILRRAAAQALARPGSRLSSSVSTRIEKPDMTGQFAKAVPKDFGAAFVIGLVAAAAYYAIFTKERIRRTAIWHEFTENNQQAIFKKMWDTKTLRGLQARVTEGTAMVTDDYKVYFLVEDEEEE